MVKAVNLGFPRMGLKRELKKALEAFWKGQSTQDELQDVARMLRHRHWNIQKNAGSDSIPVGDFSFYDHVLDTSCMVGNVPARYGWQGEQIDLDLYFAMARGCQKEGQDVVAMEMTKWFDTNYHYIVPEFTAQTKFKLSTPWLVQQVKEALEAGIQARPVQLGPVSYLLLGKMRDGGVKERLQLLSDLLPVYKQLFSELSAAGIKQIQIDEPMLGMDLCQDAHAAFKQAYDYFAQELKGLDITIATYFEGLRDNLELAVQLPVSGLHIDLVRAPQQLESVLKQLPSDKTLSLGLVDGRNIWKSDLSRLYDLGQKAVQALGKERVVIAPSCSLLHSPIDLAGEKNLGEVKDWMAFACQKLVEVKLLANALSGQIDEQAFAENKASIEARHASSLIHNKNVKERLAAVKAEMYQRQSVFSERAVQQRNVLKLPLLPTTTIGSFPQTQELRQKRADHKAGRLGDQEYHDYIAEITKKAMAFQDEIGIDVPVHGEYERNDMVEYFGEQLEGFTFTKNGWVQSYGSRCVKPPVIFGDVSRPEDMTVYWSAFAQKCTDKPVKGMLTGPITILQWSFVRDDQPREVTCKQIALAVRDEVLALENAGITMIQIDEPAIREGLPLRQEDRGAYLRWAVDSFRLSAAGVQNTTQIHTHMCYSEFNDIIDSIAELDADVISIETSRSAMELLDAFVQFKYPNEIGPGVYDIHSPRIPAVSEMKTLLQKALQVLSAEQVWVNPDCGLKTRGWPEVRSALENMVQATKEIRQDLAADSARAV